MFIINKNYKGELIELKFTKGDTLSFIVEAYNPVDGTLYKFQVGDTVDLYLRQIYSDETNILEVAGVPFVGKGVCEFAIEGSKTINLNIDGYIMQIVLTKSDGTKHTLVAPCCDNKGRYKNNVIICGDISGILSNAMSSINMYYNPTQGDVDCTVRGVLNYPTSMSSNMGTTNHAELENLDYDSSGHVGFAKDDISNVGEFAIAIDGSILYKKDGILKSAPVIINDTDGVVEFAYSINVPPNSVKFGLNTSIHENGGYLEYSTNTLNKNYILMDYENDPIEGSKEPTWDKRDVVQIKEPIFPDNNVDMNNMTVINFGVPTYDRQVQKVYMNFIDAVTNFKMALEVNGTIVSDYPEGSWENPNKQGYDLPVGEQGIQLEPYWSSLTSYDIKVYLSADNPINLRGNGVVPWFAEDLNVIEKKSFLFKDTLFDFLEENTIIYNFDNVRDMEIPYDKNRIYSIRVMEELINTPTYKEYGEVKQGDIIEITECVNGCDKSVRIELLTKKTGYVQIL